jgi:hypothetical protein
VWGWPAKLDYILKQTPASGVALQVGTGLPTSRGQTTGQKLLGYGTGLKVAPFASPQIREQRAQQTYSYLKAKGTQMRHDGDAYTPSGERTPAYQRVLDQTRAVETVLGIRKPKKRTTSGLSPAAAAMSGGGGPSRRGGTSSGLSPAARAMLGP